MYTHIRSADQGYDLCRHRIMGPCSRRHLAPPGVLSTLLTCSDAGLDWLNFRISPASKHYSRCSLVDGTDNACRFRQAPYKMSWLDDLRTPAFSRPDPSVDRMSSRWCELGRTIGPMRPAAAAAPPRAAARRGISPQPP